MSARPEDTFLEESMELLQLMEDSLLKMEDNPGDADLINDVFRSAHTIKGTGGVFSFDHVESFTHVVESVLDKVRDGGISIDSTLIALLLKCRDQMEKLVVSAVNGESSPAEEVMASSATLLTELEIYLGEESLKTCEIILNDPEVDIINEGQLVATDNWHISLRFDREILQNGMDPISFLRYMKTIGELVHVTTLNDDLPELKSLNPEECYLAFEIDFATEVSKTEIEKVFEFAAELSTIKILPPRANINEYAELIVAQDDEMRLGEILVSSGALTQRELDMALKLQQQIRDELVSETGVDTESPRIGDFLIEQKVVHKEVVDVALETQKKIASKKASSGVIRVDADKLDSLINLVGELVISGASTTLLAQKYGDEDLLESISQMSHLVEEIRDNALTLRMVQIGETFNRFKRVVRDVSAELGKNIKLEISGADAELDKTVVEKIGDPLMHLIRNAMDHGIESQAERDASGKTEQGTLYLNAYHDSGSIVIEVVDNGRGLSKEKILTKAMEKGLVTSAQNLTDSEIYRLIFEAGFSTAEKVTNLSGRGVGMDVVRSNIETLRGTVDVDSEPGKGTTISIRLPLTLAIIDGFLVGVGKSSYVVPLDVVVECIEINEEEQKQTQMQRYINLRGEVLPFMRLCDYFGESRDEDARENIVVVQYGTFKAGLVVDALLGEFQTVIKPMGKVLQKLNGISGATILGSGDVAMILDVPNLIHRAVEQSHGLTHKKSAIEGISLH